MTKDKISRKKFWIKVWATVVGGIILLFFTDLKVITYSKVKSLFMNTESTTGLDSTSSFPLSFNSYHQSAILDSGDVPFLDPQPILDQTLNINRSTGDFILGGIHIDKIRLRAITQNGDELKWRTSSFPKKRIIFDIYKEPYIEFSLQNQFYSLSIIEDNKPFRYTLYKIESSKLDLIEPKF